MKFKYILGGINWGVILLVLFGGMMLFQSIPEDIIALKPAISFEDMLEEGTEVKAGAHVSGKVPYVFDAFASEETYTRYNDGSRSGGKASGAYYLVPTAEAFIAIKGRQADVAVLGLCLFHSLRFRLTFARLMVLCGCLLQNYGCVVGLWSCSVRVIGMW